MNPTRRALLKGALALPFFSLVPFSWLQAEESPLPAVTRLVIHSDQGPQRLEVEVARTPAQRRQGLMERDSLAPRSGMLFRYAEDQPPESAFWMYRTRIPLDIAYLDEQGRIVAINRMSPCESESAADCASYPAGASYRSALEVNAGFFAEHAIKVGDCVSWPGLEGMC